VRAYPREGVRPGYGFDVRKGLQFRLVLDLPRARRDTVFRSLSFRDMLAIVPHLAKLLGEQTARVTVRPGP
jgi:hypothetical protein